MAESVLHDYQHLIEHFVNREIDAEEFEATFLDRFKNEQRQLSTEAFKALDELFGDVDMFCADDELRDDDDLDEAKLRQACERTLAVIRD